MAEARRQVPRKPGENHSVTPSSTLLSPTTPPFCYLPHHPTEVLLNLRNGAPIPPKNTPTRRRPKIRALHQPQSRSRSGFGGRRDTRAEQPIAAQHKNRKEHLMGEAMLGLSDG